MRTYIAQYVQDLLDKSDTVEPPKFGGVSYPVEGSIFEEFQVTDKAVSIFYTIKDLQKLTAQMHTLWPTTPHDCSEQAATLDLGKQHQIAHADWHLSVDDFKREHLHFLFSTDIGEKEFDCFFQQILQQQEKSGWCDLEKLHPCAIDAQNVSELRQIMVDMKKSGYDAHLAKKADEITDHIMPHIQQFQQQFIRAAIIGYGETLLRRYAFPLLLSQKIPFTVALDIIDSAVLLLKGLTTGSYNYVHDFVTRHVIAGLMGSIGISADTSEQLTTFLSTMTAIISDPSNLLSVGSASTGAIIGITTAEKTIQLLPRLPKLREEGVAPDRPQSDESKLDAAPETPLPEATTRHASLRHRTRG